MLELLISTIDGGIERAARVPLSPRAGVAYLVCWQHSGEKARPLPAALCRPDVRVIEMQGRGLSRSRNAALAASRGDVLLLVDDDCRYTADGLEGLVRSFAEHPEADILLFQARDPEGRPLRRYPAAPFDYARPPRGYYAASFEIALRRGVAFPAFDERFGLGSSCFCLGEEQVFLRDALLGGLVIRYLPLPIVATPSATTGTRFATDPSVQRAKGALLAAIYGPFCARLRSLREAFALPRSAGRWRVTREMWRGIRIFQAGQSDPDLHHPSHRL